MEITRLETSTVAYEVHWYPNDQKWEPKHNAQHNSFTDTVIVEISWGKTPSLLPGECSSQASPFPSGVTFRFLIDSQLAERNSATGTLIGFGQLAGTTDARNLSVYNVASKDQKIVTVANAFEVYVHHVITNGNIPQPL